MFDKNSLLGSVSIPERELCVTGGAEVLPFCLFPLVIINSDEHVGVRTTCSRYSTGNLILSVRSSTVQGTLCDHI